MKNNPALVWDEWNTQHIKKHRVTKNEVEQVYLSSNIKKKTYFERILILGKTHKERYMTIVISDSYQNKPYVVSARDMSRKERKYFNEKTKSNKTI